MEFLVLMLQKFGVGTRFHYSARWKQQWTQIGGHIALFFLHYPLVLPKKNMGDFLVKKHML